MVKSKGIFIRSGIMSTSLEKKININANNIEQSQENIERKETNDNVIYNTKNLDLWYSKTHALKGINLEIIENEVTAIIGPSGCGKSTYIKTLNRMVELV